MGLESNKISAGEMTTVIRDMYENVERTPEWYCRIREMAKLNVHKGTTYKIELWRSLHDSVRNGMDVLKSILGEEILNKYKQEDIISVLIIWFRLKNESGDFFYRREDKRTVANQSIGAMIKRGSLNYDYEGLCTRLVDIWNETNDKKIENWKMGLAKRKKWMNYVNCAHRFFQVSLKNQDRLGITKFWYLLNQLIDDAYIKVIDNSRHKCRNKSSDVIYLDIIVGTCRGLLLGMNKFNVDENRDTQYIDTYIGRMKKSLEVIRKNNKEEVEQYDLFQNFLLYLVMISLKHEREQWISINKYLIEETEKEVLFNEVKFQTKIADCKKIVDWYEVVKNVSFAHTSHTILYKAVYVECFLNKNRPKQFERCGVNALLRSMQNENNKDIGNLSEMELFYYEKILRGVSRELGNLERYVDERKAMLKLYEFEVELFDRKNLQGEYIGDWILMFQKNIKESVNDYLERMQL